MNNIHNLINKKLYYPSNETTYKVKRIRKIFTVLFLTIFLTMIPPFGQKNTNKAIAQSPTPTPDRLAEPEISEDPTQYEQGRHLYWLNCMPCHGDYGQGLTDEFREIWVDDHQNCWAHGCHGGGYDDEGFPIPKYVPAVIATTGNGIKYTQSEELFEYLHSTHPPQNPGYLPEDEYWALTSYVLTESNSLEAEKVIGPQAEVSEQWNTLIIALIFLFLLITIILIYRYRKTITRPNF